MTLRCGLLLLDHFDVLHATRVLAHVRLTILGVYGFFAGMPSGRSTAGLQPLVNNLLVDLIKMIRIMTLWSISSLKSKCSTKWLFPLKVIASRMCIGAIGIRVLITDSRWRSMQRY